MCGVKCVDRHYGSDKGRFCGQRCELSYRQARPFENKWVCNWQWLDYAVSCDDVRDRLRQHGARGADGIDLEADIAQKLDRIRTALAEAGLIAEGASTLDALMRGVGVLE